MHPFPRRCRTPFSRRDERGVVIPARLMLVAIVVVAAAAAMYVATSPGANTTPAATTATAASPSASSSSSSSSATPATPKASSRPSASAKASASASASASAAASASSSPRVSTPAAQTVHRASTFVEVFNNTRRKGLANRTATRAKGVGWKVVGSDNWYGTIPTSTVYYPVKLAQAAKALGRDLGITRVEPAVAPMRNDRLTVILTSDYRAR